MFDQSQVPVAYSMVKFINQLLQPGADPINKYIFYWIAFNNIYTFNASQSKSAPRFQQNECGEILRDRIAHVKIPRVSLIRERCQIELATKKFSGDLKDALIRHDSTSFFVGRVPNWGGQRLERDSLNQRLNGVLNIGRTLSRENPVWAPIDKEAYKRFRHNNYVAGQSYNAEDDRNALTSQIVDILYTIRNNTFHGGKDAADPQALEVLEYGTPLLSLIVKFFLSDKAVDHYDNRPSAISTL